MSITTAPGALITKPWHVQWRDTLLGWPDSVWSIKDITGWLTLPGARATYTDKVGRWGTFAGPMTFGNRSVEITFECTDYATAEDLRAVRRAFSPGDDPAEEPLAIWCGTDNPELIYARVDKASIPTDYQFSMGYTTCTVAFTASDPLRYGLAANTATIGAGTQATDGLAFPLLFPLTFGTASGGGVLTVVNTGTSVAWPLIEVRGPVTGPVLTHLDRKRELGFDPAFTLGERDVLSIDTAARYVSQKGAPRPDKLLVRQWWGLGPGPNRLRFTAEHPDAAARMSVTWRNASAL